MTELEQTVVEKLKTMGNFDELEIQAIVKSVEKTCREADCIDRIKENLDQLISLIAQAINIIVNRVIIAFNEFLENRKHPNFPKPLKRIIPNYTEPFKRVRRTARSDC